MPTNLQSTVCRIAQCCCPIVSAVSHCYRVLSILHHCLSIADNDWLGISLWRHEKHGIGNIGSSRGSKAPYSLVQIEGTVRLNIVGQGGFQLHLSNILLQYTNWLYRSVQLPLAQLHGTYSCQGSVQSPLAQFEHTIAIGSIIRSAVGFLLFITISSKCDTGMSIYLSHVFWVFPSTFWALLCFFT